MAKRWTDKEIQFLKDNYQGNGASYCAKHINRTIAAIHNKAKTLNLKMKK